MRYPTLDHTLKSIKQVAPDCLKYVIDVGAQRETPFLMRECAHSLHHLFEPVSAYHAELEARYQNVKIDHHVHKFALSDVNGEAYIHNFSEIQGASITHSYLSFEPTMEHSGTHISTDVVPVKTLDVALENFPMPAHSYLVKLDVDGLEEKIIAGGDTTIRSSSFIIIEASLGRRNLIERMQLIEGLGFRLFDIADHAYYYGQMSQCDLVFINESFRAKVLKFRPWERASYVVRWNKWQHGFADLEKTEIRDPFSDE